MQKITDPYQWISVFKYALEKRDVNSIAHAIANLPIFETREEMEACLLLSMDAEALLCTMRNELILQRQALQQKFTL